MIQALEKALSGFADEFGALKSQLDTGLASLDHLLGGESYLIVSHWLGDFVKAWTNIESYRLRSANAYALKLHALDAALVGTTLNKFPIDAAVAKTITLPYTFVNNCKAPLLENLAQIGVSEARKYSRGENSLVAVLDTGISQHYEFETYQGGKNFTRDDEGPIDRLGHGTHVAGTICGQRTGVAPGAQFMCAKVLSDNGRGNEVDIIRAIEWAVKKGAHIINMSLGARQASVFERRAVEYAHNKGVAVVAAAGNDGGDYYTYPASYDSAWSVAAVTNQNEHADFSNTNDKLTISAPGVNIASTWLNNRYAYLSGTSMATPHVSGVLALCHSLNIPYTKAETTAQQLGDAFKFGAGLVRADRSVR